MSSLLSLLPDLLPMIMPSEVHVTKAKDLEAQRAGTDAAMIRQGAMIGKSDKMCATVLIAKPHCSSAVHHHGEQDTIIYAASGRGILVTRPDDFGLLYGDEDEEGDGSSSEPVTKQQVLGPGDFAFIPPWTEHQEINETDEDVVWILIRSGPEPVVVYLTDWGGDEAKADVSPPPSSSPSRRHQRSRSRSRSRGRSRERRRRYSTEDEGQVLRREEGVGDSPPPPLPPSPNQDAANDHAHNVTEDEKEQHHENGGGDDVE